MKNLRKHLIALLTLVIICALFLPLPVQAATSGSCGDNVKWSLSSGILTISGTGEMDDWSGGSHFDSGYSGDQPWASQQNKIKQVRIQKGVTHIGKNAFDECNNLTSVTIADTVTSIGSYAFAFCQNLKSVTIPNSVTTIGSGVFSNCLTLTTVSLPSGLTELSDDLFLSCLALKNVNIPQGVTTIYGRAFGSCYSLKSITIPSSVTTIYYGAFDYCTALESITIPNSVTGIGRNAFENCSSLKTATLSSNLTSIPDRLFAYCTSLQSITIPDGVTSIGEYAFQQCESLEKVVLPDTVTSIGRDAFYNCYKMRNLYIEDLAAFMNIDMENANSHPTGRYYAGKKLYLNGTLVTDLVIPEEITVIPEDFFRYFDSLTSITIPDSVTSIGEGAFAHCTKVKTVQTGNGITAIDNEVFAYCNALESITMSNRLTSIGDQAFYSIPVLKSITLPDSVTSIGNEAFNGCSQLTNVELGSGVTSIGNKAFYGCDDLPAISLPESLEILGDEAFSGCKALTSITIPGSVKTFGSNVFYNCEALTDVVIGDGVTAIGESAFRYCQKLNSVVIPASVTEIGTQAFYPVFNIQELYYGGTSDQWSGLSNQPMSKYIHYRVTDPEGHWVSVQQEATCLEAGTSYEFCACDYERNRVTTQAALGHTGGTATCKDLALCTRCGTGYGDLNVNNHAGGTEIRGAFEATCSANGYTGSTYCLGCDALLERGQYTPTIAHTFGEWSVLSAPTCIYSGTEIHTCQNCGINYSREIPATGHEYQELVVPPACTEQGYTSYTCAKCGDNYVDSYVNATGHAFGDWITTQAATCTEQGQERRDCQNCDHYETREVETGGHNYVDGVCSVCQEIELLRSGQCGDNLFWKLGATGTLTIYGTGEMWDWAYFEPAPWYDYRAVIQSAVIEAGATSIGDYAFSECNNLTNVVIPEGVIHIGNAVFYHSYGLTSIVLPEGVTSIGNEVFQECTSLTDITLPESLTSMGEYVFFFCTNLENIVLPESITNISFGLFANCSNLKNITIPEGVTSIGACAFDGCSSLTSITIPEGVTSIGNAAFSDCSSLTSILIPESVTSIGNEAFSGCSRLTSVVIPEGVIRIDYATFYECISLESIVIPGSVTSIGDFAFNECSSLQNVYYGGTAEMWTSLSNRPSATYIHYSCTQPEGHWTAYSVDATCEENGYTCERCACGYERNKVTTQPATGHTFGNWTVTQNPTCTAKGMEQRDCDSCDHYETREVAVTGHDYDAVVTAPTFESQGYTTHTCTVCGDSYMDSSVPALTCVATIGGVKYESLSQALAEAGEGDVVKLTADCDESGKTLIIRPGVTLYLDAYELKADGLIGFAGSVLNAARYSTTSDYGRLVVPKENLVLTGGVAAENDDNPDYDVIPIWNGEDAYILANAMINDTDPGYGLKIDEETKTISFSFVHKAGGSANKAFFLDGTGDNALKIVIRLEWASGNGVAYQDFVYNDDFVGLVSGGGYNYSFVLNNYDILNIDLSNLKVTAMILTDAGTVTAGTTWTQQNAIS